MGLRIEFQVFLKFYGAWKGVSLEVTSGDNRRFRDQSQVFRVAVGVFRAVASAAVWSGLNVNSRLYAVGSFESFLFINLPSDSYWLHSSFESRTLRCA